MSAELLREAAAEIRKDWRDEDCSGSARAYNLAVADWLGRVGELVRVRELSEEFHAEASQASTVARAYLGRTS